MRKARTRVTVSLPVDLVELIDRSSRELKETRSALVEEWLRHGAAAHDRRALDAEIRAYYGSLTGAERREDEAIGKASSRAARALDDERPRRHRKKSAR